MYRIVIADDEPLIIRGLKKMMKWGAMDTEVVGQAEDGDQLLNLLDTLEPDIIISDISMPEKTGLDVLKEISKRKLKTKVIFSEWISGIFLCERGCNIRSSRLSS